jgi:hypothetical protein
MGATNRSGGRNKHEKLKSSNKKTNEISLRKKPIVPTPPPKAKGKCESSEGKFADDSSNSCQTESDEEYHSDSEDEDVSSSNEDITSEKGELKGYSDENALWLKPKQNKKEQQVLLSSSGSSSSSSDDEEVDDDEVYDEDDGEEEMMMDIERKSKIIDEEMELERLEAEEEMRQVIATQTSVFHLPTPEELEMDKDRVRNRYKNHDIRFTYAIVLPSLIGKSVFVFFFVVAFVFAFRLFPQQRYAIVYKISYKFWQISKIDVNLDVAERSILNNI